MSYDIEFDFDRLSQQLIINDQQTLDITQFYDIGQIKNNIHDVLRFLNYYDLDLIYLTFLARKRQVDLAKILDQTQPSVSYNLGRIRKQIQFVYYFLANIDVVVNYLQDTKDFTDYETQMLLIYFYSFTPTKASIIFNMHPITYKNKLKVILDKLNVVAPDIYKIFDDLCNNFDKIKKTPFKK